jgi:phage shock protein A
MADFFRKLNTLISSQINDVLRPIAGEDDDRGRKRVARSQVRSGLARDVEVLRKRIADAENYQQTLQARADKLRQEVARWDIAADQAVAEGRQLDARFALEQLQKAQQNLERTELELRQHQEVTDELVNKVNYLDHIVHQADDEEADAQEAAPPPAVATKQPPAPDQSVPVAQVHVLGQAPRRDAPPPTEPRAAAPRDAEPIKAPPETRKVSVRVEFDDTPSDDTAPTVVEAAPPTTAAAPPAPAPDPKEQAIRKRRSKYAKIGDEEYAEGVELAKSITQKLDQTREKLAQLTQEATQPMERDVMDEVRTEVNQIAVDDELERRISRLSKPTEPQDKAEE